MTTKLLAGVALIGALANCTAYVPPPRQTTYLTPPAYGPGLNSYVPPGPASPYMAHNPRLPQSAAPPAVPAQATTQQGSVARSASQAPHYYASLPSQAYSTEPPPAAAAPPYQAPQDARRAVVACEAKFLPMLSGVTDAHTAYFIMLGACNKPLRSFMRWCTNSGGSDDACSKDGGASIIAALKSGVERGILDFDAPVTAVPPPPQGPLSPLPTVPPATPNSPATTETL